MKFKPYPKYKASGVEWLGDVPEGWSVETFRRIVALIGNGTSEEQIDEDDSTKRVTRIETISKGVIDLEKVGFIRQFEGIDRFRLKTGDVLFSNINSLPMIGNCAIYDSNEELYAGMNLLRLRFTNDTNPDWAVYWLRSKMWRQTIEANAKPAINQASIPQSIILALPVAKPSLGEQSAIATFLDRETAKIDTLIAKQEKLIDLLKEKRQAVISHAVTKGLDTTVAMKPSGVDWLGDVPKHWTMQKMSWHFNGEKGKIGQLLTKEYCLANEGVYPVYSGQTENDGVMGTINTYEYEFENEGVLFSTTVGAKAMHLKHLRGKFSLSQNCMIIRPLTEILNIRYCYYHFQPLFSFERSQIPDHMQPSFRMEDLNSYSIALPSIQEQRAIAAFLDQITLKIDTLIAIAQQAIALQKEHRTALISAAVTGKIDVRGEGSDRKAA